jgi:hypothetical protein
MHGISSQSKTQIDKVVSDLFDKTALRLLGPIPKLHHKKHTLLGFAEGITLATLFVQAMNNNWLNNIEQDVITGILGGAFGYIEALKSKTTSSISERIDGLAREARIAKEPIAETKLNEVIQEELGKAKSGMERIAASEATKTRNLGSLMTITKKAAEMGEKDPIVYFVVIRDNVTCESCVRVNLMPDKVTPRLYRLSELSAGYFKRGDTVPSILGNHPHCRCSLVVAPTGYGFDKKGFLTFVGLDHNELDKQRN